MTAGLSDPNADAVHAQPTTEEKAFALLSTRIKDPETLLAIMEPQAVVALFENMSDEESGEG